MSPKNGEQAPKKSFRATQSAATRLISVQKINSGGFMVFKTNRFRAMAVVLGVVLGLSFWSLPSYSQMRHGRGGMAGGPNIFFLMRAAQPTPDQKTQVQTLLQNSRQNTKQIISQLMPLRQQLNSSLYSTGSADTNLINQVDGLENHLKQERYSVFQQVWSMLNSTQQSRVTSLYSQLAGNRAQRMEAWESLHQQGQ